MERRTQSGSGRDTPEPDFWVAINKHDSAYKLDNDPCYGLGSNIKADKHLDSPRSPRLEDEAQTKKLSYLMIGVNGDYTNNPIGFAWGHRHKRRMPVGQEWPCAKPFRLVR